MVRKVGRPLPITCPSGHLYVYEGGYVHPDGYRVCGECHRRQSREYMRKKRAAEKAAREQEAS